MAAVAQALVLALAATGVAGATITGLPMEKAIEIHKNHLGPDSKLPEQAMKGQHSALDYLIKNQDRWVAENHTAVPDDNETAEPN